MSAAQHGGGHGPASGNRRFGIGTLAIVAFGAILLFFLVAEHRAHLVGWLPLVLVLLLCLVLHRFMHGGHGGHGGAQDGAGTAGRGGDGGPAQHRH